MATPNPGSGSSVLPLPPDALYEILLRVPARDLCRLRAVCRPWRCLLSDPHFIAAHAGRHTEPLIVASCDTFPHNDYIICDVMDLSGRVVKRIRGTGNEWMTSIHLNFICTSTGRRFRLLNLATGSVYALPEELTEEHAAHELRTCHFHAEAAFGQVPSTGEYKVLRVLDPLSSNYQGQLCEVCTLNGSSHAQWRGKKPPPYTVRLGLWVIVVINGIVYFFSDEVQAQDAELDRIASFDLETEEWRASLRGPLSSLVEAPGLANHRFNTNELTMAEMNGCFVVVHRSFSSNLDLWFLMDFEKGIWVKQHSLQVQLSVQHTCYTVRPLLVLNDGRIVLFYIGDNKGSLRIHNLRTNISRVVTETGFCDVVGLDTGSPLSLANGANY